MERAIALIGAIMLAMGALISAEFFASGIAILCLSIAIKEIKAYFKQIIARAIAQIIRAKKLQIPAPRLKHEGKMPVLRKEELFEGKGKERSEELDNPA